MAALTPQARAVAALALGFALVAGYFDRLGIAVVTVVNGAHHNMSLRDDRLLMHAVPALAAILVVALGRRTVSGPADRWVQGIGQAGQLLAVVGLSIEVLALVSVLNDGGFIPTPGLI